MVNYSKIDEDVLAKEAEKIGIKKPVSFAERVIRNMESIKQKWGNHPAVEIKFQHGHETNIGVKPQHQKQKASTNRNAQDLDDVIEGIPVMRNISKSTIAFIPDPNKPTIVTSLRVKVSNGMRDSYTFGQPLQEEFKINDIINNFIKDKLSESLFQGMS